MESNALECEICNKVFSQENTPRILPCSHTFCGPCIDGIIATQKKTCPTCGVEFTAASAEDLMICRIALKAAKQLGSVSVKPRGATGLYLKFTKDFLESDLQISMSTKILKEMKEVLGAIEILKEMRVGILDTNKIIEASVEKMEDIKVTNENIVDKIDSKIEWLKNKMILILEEEGKTQDAEVKLESEIDSTSSGPVLDEAVEVVQEGQEKVKKIKAVLLENEKERDDIKKDIVRMKKRLEGVAKEIRTLKISAVKVIEGKQMVAPIKFMAGNQVQLIRFKEGNVPPKSLIINYEALMKTSSRRAFLDLAIKDTRLVRLVIRVKDGSDLALNFLHLCAGDLGPSYANSHFSRVEDEGRAAERICVNGYITSGNTISKAAVTKVDWNDEGQRQIYKDTSVKAGQVRGFLSDEEASQFLIVTRDNRPNLLSRNPWLNSYCFGIVEEGLEVLRGAILRSPDITDVRIVDCGLMMSE